MDEVDYLICKNCETPCYVFDMDDRGKLQNVFCQACGNDDAKEFLIPDAEDVEVDE